MNTTTRCKIKQQRARQQTAQRFTRTMKSQKKDLIYVEIVYLE